MKSLLSLVPRGCNDAVEVQGVDFLSCSGSIKGREAGFYESIDKAFAGMI